jgi:hypothetical protein
MDLDDRSGLQTRIYRGLIDERRLFAAVVVKTRWRLEGGRLQLEPEQDWKVLDGHAETPEGVVHHDNCFRKAGADVVLLGPAVAPRPVASLRVRVAIGSAFAAEVAVHGRRTWRKRLLREPEIGPAEPFTSAPMGHRQAYGGADTWDGLAMAFPDNPEGVGYYLEAANCIDKPLPTVEDPAHPIRAWNDRPEPVGLGLRPPVWGPSARRGAEFDAKGNLVKLHPCMFNTAFPACIAPETRPGDAIEVAGMTADGPWRAALPACPARAELTMGEKVHPLAWRLDQVWIEPASGRVRLAWRSPFRYTMRALERRLVSIERVAA